MFVVFGFLEFGGVLEFGVLRDAGFLWESLSYFLPLSFSFYFFPWPGTFNSSPSCFFCFLTLVFL